MLGDFFGRNPISNNFYLKLFLMRCVFLAVLSHKLNVIFYLSTYSIWEFSNPTDTCAKNVTLCGGFTELNYLCIYTLYYFAQCEWFELKPGMSREEGLLTYFPKFDRDRATSTMFFAALSQNLPDRPC